MTLAAIGKASARGRAGGRSARRLSPARLIFGAPDWPVDAMLQVMASQFILKVSWEALLTPFTYAVVGFLKRHEGVDVYDVHTDFSPFRTKLD